MRGARDDSEERHYFNGQILETARRLDYFANLKGYRSWTALKITTDAVFELVVSFHGYGRGRRGVMAASAFTYQRVPSEEKGTEFVDVRPAIPDVFQWNVKDDAGAIERRFGDWLESACAIALAEWKRTIEA